MNSKISILRYLSEFYYFSTAYWYIIYIYIGEVRRAQLAKSTLLTSTLGPLGSFQMLKRERGAESKGKLPHLFIPSKTANLVPEFAVEDLPLGRTAALLPEFAVKDLALGRTF